jgi:Phage integrase family
MTPLRQQMLDAMAVRGLAARARDLRRLAGPHGALLQAKPCGVDGPGHRGLHVAPGQGPQALLLQRQPELLSRLQIAQLFVHCHSSMVRMLLQTLYACGLRLSEGCHLRVADVDSAPDRLCVRVVAGKGGADRYSLLSPTLLALLRVHCRRFGSHQRPEGWLFFNPKTRASDRQPLSACGVQRHDQATRRDAHIDKSGSTQTCATASPPTCWRAGLTCTPSAACWATATFRPPASVPAPDQPPVQAPTRHRPAGLAGGAAGGGYDANDDHDDIKYARNLPLAQGVRFEV